MVPATINRPQPLRSPQAGEKEAELGMFLRHCRANLGASNVIRSPGLHDPLLETVSGTQRRIPAVLRPQTTAEVLAVVHLANRFRVPLYPISRGRNWGMGGPLPVRDGCAIVDLGRMNRILEVNEQHGYAVLEPGVTQGQLHAYLTSRRLPFRFNVTGSGLETSILGNALDRGVGYFSSKAENISNLEVVLGKGEILRTGFGHCKNAKTAALYAHGVGPSLDGLLMQSNFGIVTRATFELIPTSRIQGALVMGVRNEKDLPRLMDAIQKLRSRALVQSAVHVANRARSEISVAAALCRYYISEEALEPEAAARRAVRDFQKESRFAWTAIGGLLGAAGAAKEAVQEAKRLLKGIGQAVLLTDGKLSLAKKACRALRVIPSFKRKQALIWAMEPFYGMSKGIPTNAAIDSVYWPTGDRGSMGSCEPQKSKAGLRYALPILPLDGRSARDVVELTESIFSNYGFTPYITLNALSDRAVEGVINLAFDRTASSIAKANECIAALNRALRERGYFPYRVGIDEMRDVVEPNDPYWITVSDLKARLDPRGIISPGRYNLR